MAVSLVSTGVQFPDSTIQTTAASAGGTVTATASGSITAGTAVIVNSDATVSAGFGLGAVVGAESNPTSPPSKSQISVASDPATGVSLMFAGPGNPLYVYAMSVSGSTITWGTGVTIAVNSGNLYVTALGSNKFLLAYVDTATSYGYVRVASVSGTTVTLGTATQVNSPNTIPSNTISVAYNPSTGTCIVGYQNGNAPYYPYAAVVSISGTTASVGSPVLLEAIGSGGAIGFAYNTKVGKMFAVWGGQNSPQTLTGAPLTMSGTTVSVGTRTAYNLGWTATVYDMIYDSYADRLYFTFLYYNSSTGSQYQYLGTCTPTASTVTWPASPSTTIMGGANQYYNGIANRVVAPGYCVAGNTAYIMGTGSDSLSRYFIYNQITQVNGATVVGTNVILNSTTPQTGSSFPQGSVGWDVLNSKFVHAFNTASGGAGVVGGLAFNPAFSSVNNFNFLGLSAASYTNGQTATVTIIGGVNTAVSGLTPGQTYYVQDDGTLGLSAGVNSVKAGLATSATKLLVKN